MREKRERHPRADTQPGREYTLFEPSEMWETPRSSPPPQERKSLKSSIERYKEITRYEKGLTVGVGPIPMGDGTIAFEIKDDSHGTYCEICVKKDKIEGGREYIRVYADHDQLLRLSRIVGECIELIREIT